MLYKLASQSTSNFRSVISDITNNSKSVRVCRHLFVNYPRGGSRVYVTTISRVMSNFCKLCRKVELVEIEKDQERGGGGSRPVRDLYSGQASFQSKI